MTVSRRRSRSQLRQQRAVIYLRVSTKDQAERGGEAEGFSIPAQREACSARPSSSAPVVAEFVDAGESARSAAGPTCSACSLHPREPVGTSSCTRLTGWPATAPTMSRSTWPSSRPAPRWSRSREHRRDAFGDAAARHHELDRRVLQPNLATEVIKGIEPEGQAGGTPGRRRSATSTSADDRRPGDPHRRPRPRARTSSAGPSRPTPPATGLCAALDD